MPHIVQLAIMIKRDKESIITKGDTLIRAGDNIILSVPPYTPSENEQLQERVITKKDAWCNKMIGELELGTDVLIAMVLRDGESIIPHDAENDLLSFSRFVLQYG